jgi:hypothetical protein
MVKVTSLFDFIELLFKETIIYKYRHGFEMIAKIMSSESKQAELIVFIEVASREVINLTKNIRHISKFPYPYEYHLTIGWFTDKNLEALCKWGNRAVEFINEQISGLEHLKNEGGSFSVIVDGAARQHDSRGGGFYLQLNDQSAEHALVIHKLLTSLLESNNILKSELMLNYHPHITFTPQITRDIISEHEGKSVLQIINNRISGQNLRQSGSLMLKPVVARAILKYQNELSAEQKKTWDCKLERLGQPIYSPTPNEDHA